MIGTGACQILPKAYNGTAETLHRPDRQGHAMERYSHPAHFWNRDLREMLRETLSDVWTLTLTLVMFLMLGLPVIIPGLLMWLTQILTGWP